jgi:Uma2 family endonuclease
VGKIATNLDSSEREMMEERVELIDGQVIHKALPGGKHGHIENRVSSSVGTLFDRKKRADGRGGWWILSEVTVQYRKVSEKGRMLTADIAGWKRDRVPVCPSEYPVPERPDWVCEICHTTRRKDTTIVPETLAAEGVNWYWFLDVDAENLMVYELAGSGFMLRHSLFREDGKVRIPPFDAVELSMPVLLGDDPEDDE